MINKKTWIVDTVDGRFEISASNYHILNSNLHFYNHDLNNNNMKEDIATFVAGHWTGVWIDNDNVKSPKTGEYDKGE